MSVIVTLGPVVNGGENVLLNGINMDEIVKRSHVINNLHVRCVLGAFKIVYMRSLFGLDTDMHYLLSYTNQYLFTFKLMVQIFITDIQILMTMFLMIMGVLSN